MQCVHAAYAVQQAGICFVLVRASSIAVSLRQEKSKKLRSMHDSINCHGFVQLFCYSSATSMKLQEAAFVDPVTALQAHNNNFVHDEPHVPHIYEPHMSMN